MLGGIQPNSNQPTTTARASLKLDLHGAGSFHLLERPVRPHHHQQQQQQQQGGAARCLQQQQPTAAERSASSGHVLLQLATDRQLGLAAWGSRVACCQPLVDTLASSQAPGPLTAAFIRLLQQHSSASKDPRAQSAGRRRPGSKAAVASLQSQHVAQLLQSAAALAPQLQPHQASLLLYVCAKCQLQCEPQLLSTLLQQLQPHHLQRLPPAGIVNAAWALAVLRLQPDADWVAALYDASSSGQRRSTASVTSSPATSSNVDSSSSRSSSRSTLISTVAPAAKAGVERSDSSSSGGGGGSVMPFPAFNRHQLVQLLWASARLRLRPPSAWLAGLLAALQPHLPALSSSELTNLMWALAHIGFRPSHTWLGAWFLASRRALRHCSPHCLACQAASLGLLRVRLSSGRWLVGFRAAVLQQLHDLQPQHIASILCGLAKRRSPTPPHWLEALLLRQLQLLGCSGCSSPGAGGLSEPSHGVTDPCGRDVAATVWSLPLLLYPTAAEWASQPGNTALLKQLVAVSLPLLLHCSVGELVQLAVGFARLGYYPGAHWLKVHENAVAQHRLPLTDVNRVRLQASVRQLWKDS